MIEKLKYHCWCGQPMITDGKRKWCSTSPEEYKPHDRYNKEELEGKTGYLPVKGGEKTNFYFPNSLRTS